TIDPIEEMHRIVTESPITVAWDCGGADNSYLVYYREYKTTEWILAAETTDTEVSITLPAGVYELGVKTPESEMHISTDKEAYPEPWVVDIRKSF
ncbi:MAG: hypothetical protein GY804_02695, partial [Alphaproteobacteria bacterium]|nr:hypothetical protein [Alphaproteobacteria bacterium]